MEVKPFALLIGSSAIKEILAGMLAFAENFSCEVKLANVDIGIPVQLI